jgi:hypothetical protein
MYSLYSQLFEGLTDYLLNYTSNETQETEKQKGPIASGKILAHIDSEGKGQLERRILHDYTYNRFEAELERKNSLLEYNSSSKEDILNQITPGKIVKVEGSANFNDMEAIGELVKRFNEFGYSLTYVTTHEERQQNLNRLNTELVKASKKGQGQIQKEIKNISKTVKSIAESDGFYLDEDFLGSLGILLDYGYNKQFEIQIMPHGKRDNKPFFSCILKKDCLREDSEMISKKFSRQAPGIFCLLGIVCQSPKQDARPVNKDVEKIKHLKHAMSNMINALCEIETGFVGRFDNEIVIDPIAFYRDIVFQLNENTI